MKKIIFILIPFILFCNACALEVANVIGTGGGYVFYDKGNYNGGWRYIECAPIDAGKLENVSGIPNLVTAAEPKINEFSFGKFNNWVLPDDMELEEMLKSLRWELTRFKNEYQFLSSTGKVYRNNYDSTLFGKQEEVYNPQGKVYIRLIRRF